MDPLVTFLFLLGFQPPHASTFSRSLSPPSCEPSSFSPRLFLANHAYIFRSYFSPPQEPPRITALLEHHRSFSPSLVASEPQTEPFALLVPPSRFHSNPHPHLLTQTSLSHRSRLNIPRFSPSSSLSFRNLVSSHPPRLRRELPLFSIFSLVNWPLTRASPSSTHSEPCTSHYLSRPSRRLVSTIFRLLSLSSSRFVQGECILRSPSFDLDEAFRLLTGALLFRLPLRFFSALRDIPLPDLIAASPLLTEASANHRGTDTSSRRSLSSTLAFAVTKYTHISFPNSILCRKHHERGTFSAIAETPQTKSRRFETVPFSLPCTFFDKLQGLPIPALPSLAVLLGWTWLVLLCTS